jgi:hypothetical protein
VTSIGYKSRKCTQAVQGGLLWVIRALQSNINICYSPPACNFKLITEDLPGSWPGRYMKMDSPKQNSLVPQFVRYHSLSGTICLCLQACNVLLQTRPGYMTCWVESLCMKRFWTFLSWHSTLHCMCCPDHSREKKQ